MDCERFDKIVLELIYDELDELSAAAARRHAQQCKRCQEIEAGLRATREVGVLPLVDLPEGFESRVLNEERRVRAGLPLDQRASHWISVAAAYAMRPQLAMAALVMLMVGSGLILFRARPAQEADQDLVQHVVEPTGRSAEGDPTPAVVSTTAEIPGDDSAPTPDRKHCEQDLKGMLETYERYPSTSRGQASLWEAVHCQELMGDTESAKANLRRLVSVDAFKDRASAKLEKLEAPAIAETKSSPEEADERSASKPTAVATRKKSASASKPAVAESSPSKIGAAGNAGLASGAGRNAAISDSATAPGEQPAAPAAPRQTTPDGPPPQAAPKTTPTPVSPMPTAPPTGSVPAPPAPPAPTAPPGPTTAPPSAPPPTAPAPTAPPPTAPKQSDKNSPNVAH